MIAAKLPELSLVAITQGGAVTRADQDIPQEQLHSEPQM